MSAVVADAHQMRLTGFEDSLKMTESGLKDMVP